MYRANTPSSFIDSILIEIVSDDNSLLSENEYFALRWWELERLQYREDIEVCLISCEDTFGIKNKILIDVRTEKTDLHVKNSYVMDDQESLSDLYSEFLALYHHSYPDNLIVIIGDKDHFGHKFAKFMLEKSEGFGQIGRICVLRGGIDAV